MRILAVVAPALLLFACTPMRVIDGSSRRFLTPAGTTISFNKSALDVTAAVEVYFQERGFEAVQRATVNDNNRVTFFKGPRRTRSGGSSFVADGIGSWFAVRFLTDGPNKTTLQLYGKPTVNGQEACDSGDRDLRDTGYTCARFEQRADWPGHQLVEGREETQVISTIIARLGERWPVE